MFIHRNKLFKLLVCYSIAAMGLNLFFVLAGNIHFDINVLLFSSLLWGLEAAETAVVLFLFIVTANCLAIINIKTRLYCYNIISECKQLKKLKLKLCEVEVEAMRQWSYVHTACNSLNFINSFSWIGWNELNSRHRFTTYS